MHDVSESSLKWVCLAASSPLVGFKDRTNHVRFTNQLHGMNCTCGNATDAWGGYHGDVNMPGTVWVVDLQLRMVQCILRPGRAEARFDTCAQQPPHLLTWQLSGLCS